jgi:hypothetical protein
MKGAASRTAETGNYQFDQDGYLVRLEGETDEQLHARTAEALFQEGMSANHPSVVMSQYDEAEPPDPEIEEGMTKEQFNEKRNQVREEWGKKNEENRKKAYENMAKEREEREQAREKRDEELGYNKEGEGEQRQREELPQESHQETQYERIDLYRQ